MRATLSRNGRKTTTPVGRIRHSTTRHRRPLPPNSPQQAITLRSVMAPRAGLLLTPPERAYSCRDSDPQWGILQWQVTRPKADAMAIWIVQWAGQEIRVLDYIEGQGQVLGYYTNELHHRG